MILMYNDIINKVVSNMTVKMTRLRNGIVIVLLIEFVLALLGYILSFLPTIFIFISVNKSLVHEILRFLSYLIKPNPPNIKIYLKNKLNN